MVTEFPFQAALRDFPRLRQSLLGDFHACSLMTRFKLEHAKGWHTNPQARGSHFHRWAARVLEQLAQLNQDSLTDEAECPGCGARPNELLTDGEATYHEGNACPNCGTALVLIPLQDLALGILADVLSQRDLEPEDWLPLPSPEDVKDLEWVVCKFAREQRFNMAAFVETEVRLDQELEYPDPRGGTVRRVLSGQLDALFIVDEGEDGWHAVVPDWKDTWDLPGALQISTEGYWQQRFYAWLVMTNHPQVMRCTLDETYVRFTGGDDGQRNHRKATIHRKQLPKIERQLAVVAELFDRSWSVYQRWLEADEEGRAKLQVAVDNSFTPTPGGHCGWCPLPHHCPILPEVRRDGAVRTPEEAQVVAGRLVVAKRIVKAHEKMLESYLKGGGESHGRPSARVTKATGVPSNRKGGDPDGLLQYKDHRPGLPEGVPVKHAKGRKVLALVEGVRRSKPSREQVEDLMEKVKRGIPVDVDSLYGEAASTSLRLVEEAVPVDDAPNDQVMAAIDASLARLEGQRG